MGEEQKITISLRTAKKLDALYEAIVKADNRYKTCQATQFREEVRGTYLAPNVMIAYMELANELDKANGGDEHADTQERG